MVVGNRHLLKLLCRLVVIGKLSCGCGTSAVAFVLLKDMFLPSTCVVVLEQVHAHTLLHLGDGIISSGTPGWGLGCFSS